MLEGEGSEMREGLAATSSTEISDLNHVFSKGVTKQIRGRCGCFPQSLIAPLMSRLLRCWCIFDLLRLGHGRESRTPWQELLPGHRSFLSMCFLSLSLQHRAYILCISLSLFCFSDHSWCNHLFLVPVQSFAHQTRHITFAPCYSSTCVSPPLSQLH